MRSSGITTACERARGSGTMELIPGRTTPSFWDDMAKGATIYKADIEIADMDRDYYQKHALTIACHPSETEERMMVRLLTFVLFAHNDLAFGGGVSTPDEPDLWQKDMTGSVKLWIEIGHPEEKKLRRACGRAERVVVVCYAGRASQVWWTENQEQFQRLKNLSIVHLPPPAGPALSGIVDRNMTLQCNIQDDEVTVIRGDAIVTLDLEFFLGSRDPVRSRS